MGIEKKVYSFRLDEKVMDEIKKISEEENRSISNLVETILKKFLKFYDYEKQ